VSNTTKTISDFTSNLFGFGGGGGSTATSGSTDKNVNFGGSSLGQATKETVGSTKTWDGYSKMNEMETAFQNAGPSAAGGSSRLSEREKNRKKKMMIKKLEEWMEKGLLKNVTHFNSDSPYEDVEDEYETALEDKRKKDSIKLSNWWFMTFINSIEYANAAFNPFDINLDGWGEQVSEDIDSYDEIFGELHEKYKGGKLAPELSLLLRVGFSAAVVNFTNKALSTATPGFNDVIRSSPEMMKMFSNATVNAMSQQSPGFAFASNLMNQPTTNANNSTNFGPPPPPMETKNMGNVPRPGASMNFTQEPPKNRQDISMARGAMFRETGVDVNQNYSSVRTPEPPPQPIQTQSHDTHQRPDMRGPQNVDLDSLLSGLKTKTVDIHSNEQPQQQHQPQYSSSMTEETMNFNFNGNGDLHNADDSLISISSLKSLQNASMPKKSRRKNRSERNIISLDI